MLRRSHGFFLEGPIKPPALVPILLRHLHLLRSKSYRRTSPLSSAGSTEPESLLAEETVVDNPLTGWLDDLIFRLVAEAY